MKRLFLLVLSYSIMLVPIYGKSIIKGDFYYTINELNKTASIDGLVNKKSQAKVEIPEYFIHDGKKYTITAINPHAFADKL